MTSNEHSPTTNDRIRITIPQDHDYGKTGTIVSGPGERILHRVLLDSCNQLNHPVYRYLISNEFEVIKRAVQGQK